MKKLLTGMLSLAACAVIALGVLPQKASAVVEGLQIRSGNSSAPKCMTVHGGVYDDWVGVDLYDCLSNAQNQRFDIFQSGQYDGSGNPYWIIMPHYSDTKCVSIANGTATDGVPLILYSCANPVSANQLFTMTNIPGASGSMKRFKAKSSGKYLQINGGGTANNTPISQWAWFAAPHYYWYLW
jgi:hypothetical protein